MVPSAGVRAARAVLGRAIEERTFPSAVAEVGESHGVLWREAFGTLTFDDAAPAAEEDTVFDLASLTKPIATTSVVMQLVADGALGLDEPVWASFEEWRGADREAATVQDLLEHAAGLSPRLVDPPPPGRREFEHDICTMPLEYMPRAKSIYGDLGFILLGFLVADRGRRSLAAQFDGVMARQKRDTTDNGILGNEMLTFTLLPGSLARTAPTRPMDEDVRRGRTLTGEVHDNYAAALGDSSVPVPFSPPLVARATMKSTAPGSSRALGWDTMLPTSSCGTEMSPAAFGHVGFTGTSVWIDPILDRYFVLLTNRACGGGTLDKMRASRRAFHDALASGLS